MTTRKTLLAAVAAAVLSATPLAAQVPIGSLTGPGTTVQGTVGEVFGDKFVLRDNSGAILVKLGPDAVRRIEVQPGERLTVIGKPKGMGSFDAFTLVRENGERIEVRPVPGPMPRSERERRAETRMAPAQISERELRARLAALGYSDVRDIERKPRHFEVTARNPRGERVELHVDYEGSVYKELWLDARRGDRR